MGQLWIYVETSKRDAAYKAVDKYIEVLLILTHFIQYN